MIKVKEANVREMLLDLGVPSFLADMAIPFMFFMPGTTDPDSPSIIEIIRGLQRGVRKLGYKDVRVTGVLDRQTALALDQISPPRGSWMRKTWVQLYGDVLRAKKDPERTAHKMLFDAGVLGSYFEYEGPPVGPLPGVMVGTPPGPLGLGATATDSGIALSFGLGITNKKNCVPIPRRSGATFSAFKNLQRQINRVLTTIPGGGRIGEDGVIGGGTVSGFNKAVGSIPLLGSVLKVDNCSALAKRAASLGSTLKTFADRAGISTAANKGSSRTTGSAETTPRAMTPEEAATAAAGGGAMAALKKFGPFLLLAAGVAWWASKKKKK